MNDYRSINVHACDWWREALVTSLKRENHRDVGASTSSVKKKAFTRVSTEALCVFDCLYDVKNIARLVSGA